MAEPAVLYEVKDRIAEITLNRPENRNSMTDDVLEGLREAVAQVKADGDVRCLIVTGRGKSFCAGADFKSGAQRDQPGGAQLLPHERSFAMYSPFLSLLEVEVPIVGALNGHAVGGMSPNRSSIPTGVMTGISTGTGSSRANAGKGCSNRAVRATSPSRSSTRST